MKNVFILATVISFAVIPQLSFAKQRMSVAGMNLNAEQCFTQTVKIEQGAVPDTLSTRQCKRVLQSSWLSNEREAITRFNRGLIYQYQGHVEKALRDFKRAVAVQPKLYSAQVALGQLLLNQKKYEESILHFDKALLISQEDKRLVRKRALVAKLFDKSRTLLISKNDSVSKK